MSESDTVRAIVRQIQFRKLRHYPAPLSVPNYTEEYWEGCYLAPDGTRKYFSGDTLKEARAKARAYLVRKLRHSGEIATPQTERRE